MVPERLEEIVEKALTKNKDERYQTSKDLLIDLKRLQQTLQLKAVSERSTSPDKMGIATAGGQANVAKPEIGTPSTQLASSSAEYIVNQVRGHKVAAVIALALGFAVILAVAVAVLLRRSDERRAGPIAAGEIHTIAVLPLANLSGDAAQDYFADGMTDELITEIAKLGDVQVISRGSVMRFKN